MAKWFSGNLVASYCPECPGYQPHTRKKGVVYCVLCVSFMYVHKIQALTLNFI